MDNQEADLEEEQRDVDQLELIKSYLAFGLASVKKRRRLALIVFAASCALWLIGLAFWPRTYYADSTIVFRRNAVLEGGENYPFSGANDVVRRRENLRDIVRKAKLSDRYEQDRQPLYKLKDRLVAIFRPMEIRGEHLESISIGMLEDRLEIHGSETSLTIGINWGNPEVAVKLVEIVQQSFLESRHAAEIMTIQEKMSILDEHSSRMRKEIDAIAGQLQALREERAAEIGRSSALARSAAAAPATAPAAAAPRPRVAAVVASSSTVSKEALAELSEQLEAKKRELNDLKSDKNRRVLAAKAELASLLERYTRAHPEVQRMERSIEALSTGDTEQTTALEAEVAALSKRLKDQTAAVPKAEAHAGGGSAPAPAAGGRAAQAEASEVLPAEVLKLLQSGAEVDPAAMVQLQGAVSKYASLRDQIRTARVDLDTAQAAFNHRYKVLAPPELPGKPSKPRVSRVVLMGSLASLLLALLVPIIAELKRGVLVARWQVHGLDVPILGELHLPPGPKH